MTALKPWFVVLVLILLATACADDEASSPDEQPGTTDGLVLVEGFDDSHVSGQWGDVLFKAVSFQNGNTARARFWTADGREELYVQVESRGIAEVYYRDTVVDGYGAATADEIDALRAIDDGPLFEALAMIPLELGCQDTIFEPVATQALLFPWQLLLKYRASQPEASAHEMAQRSSCGYFQTITPADEGGEEADNPGYQILLSWEDRFPAVYGYAVLDAEGEAGGVEPQLEETASGALVACGFGPGGSGCRGSCGADCTSNNCQEIPMRETICGQSVSFTRYICGVHQGCIDHDICYDECTRDNSTSVGKFACLRGCDGDAIEAHGLCNTYGWSRGFGTHSHTVDFYYHRNCGQNECVDGALEERGRRRVRTTGDPHLVTADRLGYDFQAAGEFVLVESLRDTEPFVVQVRQQSAGSELCPGSVAYNTGFATVMADKRVAIYSGTSTPLRIDGAAVEVDNDSIDLGNGAVIARDGRDFSLIYPSGEAVDVRVSYGHLNVYVNLPDTRMGEYRGLLGSYNGDSADDIATRDGTVLEQPIHFDDLYGRYADSWRIDNDESLFDYAPGEGTEAYQRPGVPGRIAIDQLPLDVRESSREICEEAGVVHPSLLEDCVVDVGCTGDPAFADLHATLPEPDETLELIKPVFLDGWTREGDPNSGDWSVDESGRALTQRSNDPPSFFVSPNPFFHTTIRGTIEVQTTSDDDLVGFLFGYESPLSANGDAPTRIRTYILSWKQTDQSFGGYTALEGLQLGYIDGEIALNDYLPTFWGHEPSEVYTPVATYVGEGTGWSDNFPHTFGLNYGADGIQVAMDGQLIFDIDASELSTPLRPGRFGFYNYSQPQVRYSDFSSSDRIQDLVVSDFDYGSFAQGDPFFAFRDTEIGDGVIRLTPSSGSQTGTVWYLGKPRVVNGFETEFTFRIYDGIEYDGQDAADGFAFVIHDAADGLEALGQTGLGLGYAGLERSVALEFDIFQNSFDPDGNHVSVQTRGVEPNAPDSQYSLGLVSDGLPDFADGEVHRVRLVYDAGATRMQVYVDDATTPTLEVDIDLADLLQLQDGQAYVGFTSSTGFGAATHEIESWRFDAQ